METEVWVREGREDYYDTYSKVTKINNTYYKIQVEVNFYLKSRKIWIAASSGTKRKHLEDYYLNDHYRDGGIKALIWYKNQLEEIIKLIDDLYRNDKTKQYICIHWEDNKRRNVYSRLQKEGFRFAKENGVKILRKRIKWAHNSVG